MRLASSGNPELAPGDDFGPYRIEAMLGEGGMGVVYRATHQDNAVALKVVKLEFASDPQYRQRFLHEARAAAEVEHPHLVNVLDAGEIEGRQYLAMPLITGQPLDERLEQAGALSAPELVRLVGELGPALDALHAHGLIHRDIKPANILLAHDGSSALTDFGLAKGQEYAALTLPGQVVGTIEYLAPERIRGEDASPASDIYALGCVAFTALVGRPPFSGTGPMGAAFGHLGEDPPDPCAERAELPQAFGAALLSALEKSPAERPANGRAYADALASTAGAP